MTETLEKMCIEFRKGLDDQVEKIQQFYSFLMGQLKSHLEYSEEDKTEWK